MSPAALISAASSSPTALPGRYSTGLYGASAGCATILRVTRMESTANAAIFVGGQIVRLDHRLVGGVGRAQPHEAAARRLQVAHARGQRGKFVQRIAELVERQRLHVELQIGALARRIRAREQPELRGRHGERSAAKE